ncbi:uncharacterized protein TM35_000062250 [Trypanosoma theileri]|uniref:Uncharacterized protein n=1 Tax=Trypanosoma theileri TaxID=67003 RepID=A0A1X0P447_9TRYP|nr:uncharacterized protein TM35_000062250 [Trypanosoma theileri]ORC91220.1 hypothetical protein TM35_000062250 [Trypanosoma theileri]
MTNSKTTVIDFLTQACCGTIMAVHRMGNTDPELYKDQLVALLARYLNNCWNSLLRGDDSFVLDCFAATGHDHPSCVLKKMFALGTFVLPDRPPLELANCNPEVPADLDAARVLVSNFLQRVLSENWNDSIWGHECDALSLNEERALWTQNGCPTDDFFVLSS